MQLAWHDGTGRSLPLLIACGGKVYDVTDSYLWAGGLHWGDHYAGTDLTGQFDRAVHGPEMLDRVHVSESWWTDPA